MPTLQFRDRQEAGELLAGELSALKIDSDTIVLGLTRGGVPVAFPVADRLGLPLEAVVVRKIGVPWRPECAMGAIAGSVRVLDEPLIGTLGIGDEEIANALNREQQDMNQRENLLHGNVLPVQLQDRPV